jgi:hypothetical protein
VAEAHPRDRSQSGQKGVVVSYHFRPAKRSEAKPLVGLYSESGCGKTYSALLLARGFAGSGRIGMIETEAGRGEAYADIIPGGYDVVSIRGDFSPKAYGDAITVAEQAPNLSALIIDSASHEWEGAGGVLSMAAANQAAGKKGVLVWQMPKMDHQRHFMLRLMATPIPLVIICMRAKYPMLEKKAADGSKEWIRSTDLEPKQSDDILFEMFVHGWIDRQHKFHGTKYTLPELRQIIRDNEPISLESGARLAAWARGESAAAAADRPQATVATSPAALPLDDAAADWLTKINDARTKAELLAVGQDLSAARSTMPDAVYKEAARAFDARMKTLRAA